MRLRNSPAFVTQKRANVTFCLRALRKEHAILRAKVPLFLRKGMGTVFSNKGQRATAFCFHEVNMFRLFFKFVTHEKNRNMKFQVDGFHQNDILLDDLLLSIWKESDPPHQNRLDSGSRISRR